jgi:uncharacterized protein with beta-barrel porin domain
LVAAASSFAGSITNAAGALITAQNGIRVGFALTSSGAYTVSNFSGSITNQGRITAADSGIGVGTVSTFGGGISNNGTIVARSGAGIRVLEVGSFSGGISNSGAILGNGTFSKSRGAIDVVDVGSFGGGITNSGTISGGPVNGILVEFVNTFSGGISNSGTIQGDATASKRVGVIHINVDTFDGGITNRGTLAGANTGIYVSAGTFLGGITNTGTISGGGIGIKSTSSTVSVFDSGVIVGSGGIAVDLSFNLSGNTFTLGPGYSITGLVVGQGVDTFQLGGSGSGTFDLSAIGSQYTGFTTFNVVSGTWTVSNTDPQSQPWTVTGGVLAGTGTLPGVSVNAGGTLAPGTPGVAGTTMKIIGNLTFASGAFYLDTIAGASASKTVVTGSATLGGASVQVASGSVVTKGVKYTILTDTAGDLGGANIFNPVVLYGANQGFLSYDANDVYLTFALNSNLLPLLPPGAPANVVRVANTIDNFIAGGGTLPPGFVKVFGLSGVQLVTALTQLSGEGGNGATVQTGYTAAYQFINTILDQSIADRGGNDGTSGSNGYADEDGDAWAYTGKRKATQAERDAYAAVTPRDARRDSFTGRWSVWASGYGGSSSVSGDASLGTHTTSSSIYGTAVGTGYRIGRDTLVGFAMGGGGTGFRTAGSLGSGHADLFQAGLYGRHSFGAAYVAGALAYGWQDFTVDRTVSVAGMDQLRSRFDSHSFSARAEAGYRFVTAFAA